MVLWYVHIYHKFRLLDTDENHPQTQKEPERGSFSRDGVQATPSFTATESTPFTVCKLLNFHFCRRLFLTLGSSQRTCHYNLFNQFPYEPKKKKSIDHLDEEWICFLLELITLVFHSLINSFQNSYSNMVEPWDKNISNQNLRMEKGKGRMADLTRHFNWKRIGKNTELQN